MKNINELDPNDKNAIAIKNVIKIRNWVKQNIPADCIGELYSNGAHGKFEENGYHYWWDISKERGIAMGVGCIALCKFNDPHISSGCGDYHFHDDEGFYYDYAAAHFGVFIDRWPSIKQTILNIYERVKARREFEP